MKRFYLALLLAVIPIGSAWADHFEQVVSLRCDRGADRLVVAHHGDFNEAGDKLVESLHANEWNPRNLLAGDGETVPVISRKPVVRYCALRRKAYKVVISGVTWNRVGSDQTAHVLITAGPRRVFDRDLQSSPFETEKPSFAVTSIVVADGSDRPQVTVTDKVSAY